MKQDLKRFKNKLYNIIDCKIWIKLYLLLVLFTIHATWLFFTVFSKDTDKDLIFGFPLILIFPYILYILVDINNNQYVNYSTSLHNLAPDVTSLHPLIEDDPYKKRMIYKINKYINFLVSIYILFIFFIILIPNELKIMIKNTILEYIKKLEII
jgi:hypothetical protein